VTTTIVTRATRTGRILGRINHPDTEEAWTSMRLCWTGATPPS